jgi:hypothetical protein
LLLGRLGGTWLLGRLRLSGRGNERNSAQREGETKHRFLPASFERR